MVAPAATAPRYLMPPANETIAYHAARLLLVVALCGTPQGGSERRPGVKGRTLLAKLDFFLRYPAYLARAASIEGRKLDMEDLGLSTAEELDTVESRMVRYRYGPWDHVYYTALAYLIGKGLLQVELEGGTETFRLTELGQSVAKQLAEDPAYGDLAQRAESVYRLFNRFSGSRLKDYIYRNFPEVVGRKLGATI